MSKKNLHTLIALVEDKPGVLSRVMNLFRKRGYNIESLSVGHSETAGVSRITFVVNEADENIEQVSKQLYKIINVLKVYNVTEKDIVERELCLVRVVTNKNNRQDLLNLIQMFEAKNIDVQENGVVVQIVDTSKRVDDFIKIIKKFGIKELTRTGCVAMVK
jgi:acetolactate synthase-1/3 small subunit